MPVVWPNQTPASGTRRHAGSGRIRRHKIFQFITPQDLIYPTRASWVQGTRTGWRGRACRLYPGHALPLHPWHVLYMPRLCTRHTHGMERKPASHLTQDARGVRGTHPLLRACVPSMPRVSPPCRVRPLHAACIPCNLDARDMERTRAG